MDDSMGYSIGLDRIQRHFKNGMVHNQFGPAIIDTYGNKFWYINGKEITYEVWYWMRENNITYPWDKETQMLFELTWC
jgi:hypothetical protein